MKICPKCRKNKPLSDFYNHKGRKDGKSYICKACDDARRISDQRLFEQRNPEAKFKKRLKGKLYRNTETGKFSALKGRLKNNYNLTPEAYNIIFNKQQGLCAICGNSEIWIEPRTKKLALLAVDHDHKTNKIRGLLCRRCNSSLGGFRDNPEILKKAIEYLNRTNGDPDAICVVH